MNLRRRRHGRLFGIQEATPGGDLRSLRNEGMGHG